MASIHLDRLQRREAGYPPSQHYIIDMLDMNSSSARGLLSFDLSLGIVALERWNVAASKVHSQEMRPEPINVAHFGLASKQKLMLSQTGCIRSAVMLHEPVCV
eukprot:6185413-Pleurochrysis_carterae.AAC.2